MAHPVLALLADERGRRYEANRRRVDAERMLDHAEHRAAVEADTAARWERLYRSAAIRAEEGAAELASWMDDRAGTERR